MSYGFTTGKYSGHLSWGIQTDSYNTAYILEDDRTQALPLKTHWQGRSFTYREVEYPYFPGPLGTRPSYLEKPDNPTIF